MAENLKENLSNHLFLILLKFIPHFIALLYAIITIIGFFNIDVTVSGYFIHVSFLTWIFLFLTSVVFRFCYVHRLPLYYILINEILVILDYFIHLPIDTLWLFVLHLSIIILFILGYTVYYKNDRSNRKRIE